MAKQVHRQVARTGDRAAAQVGDAHQVERFLDPFAHRDGGDAELFHAVGDLVLDPVGDEGGDRVLADVAHDRVERLESVAGDAEDGGISGGNFPGRDPIRRNGSAYAGRISAASPDCPRMRPRQAVQLRRARGWRVARAWSLRKCG